MHASGNSDTKGKRPDISLGNIPAPSTSLQNNDSMRDPAYQEGNPSFQTQQAGQQRPQQARYFQPQQSAQYYDSASSAQSYFQLSSQEPAQQDPAQEEPARREALQENRQEITQNTRVRKRIKSSSDSKDGRVQCPACGASDISPAKDGRLRCNFCHKIFESENVAENASIEKDIFKLEGENVTAGADDIDKTTSEDVITVKCEGCGADISIPSGNTNQTRCHWCRSYLSFNAARPNGSVPDAILPFSVTREEAQALIGNFVDKRQFFAHPTFKKEFTTENILPVYFPYYVVDVNAHAHLAGQGEHEIRRYTISTGPDDDDRKTVYDIDIYNIEREFDIAVNDLTLDASREKLDVANKDATNNIVNSIMPFDTENCVKYDSNYLRGTTVEPRDTNISDVRGAIELQSKDIARHSMLEHVSEYDRGVRWDNEKFDVFGTQWMTAFLPVWMYSYYERKKDGTSMLHYAAVNARTKETMGSVPINFARLWAVSGIIEAICAVIAIILAVFLIASGDLDNDADALWVFLLLAAGPIFFFSKKRKYRNDDARHYHEKETKYELRNLRKSDDYDKRVNGVDNPRIHCENGCMVEGDIFSVDIGNGGE